MILSEMVGAIMKILIILGTRPEAIKLAPLINVLKNNTNYDIKVCSTDQHKEMILQVLNIFDIKIDIHLNIMKVNQTLADITSLAVTKLYDVIGEYKPNLVIVQGDTTTAFVGALSAFYHKVPVAHLEAGLRTYNIFSPFPEEANRKFISQIASYHFAPTEKSYNNLINEQIKENVYITGNSVIDALLYTSKYVETNKSLLDKLSAEYPFVHSEKKLILLTSHRRENHGSGLENICKAVKEIACRDDVNIVFPVHPNPNVRKTVYSYLSDINNIFLIEPLDYISFTFMIKKAYLVLTDSGGVQEEAPTLGKPVIVLRDTTEREEAVVAGTAILAGTECDNIIKETNILLDNKNIYDKMANAVNPYGTGDTCNIIVDIIKSKESSLC